MLSLAAASTSLVKYSQQRPLVSQKAISGIEEIIKQEVLNNLPRVHLGLAPDYAATSCKQRAELKPQYDSGYYWGEGAILTNWCLLRDVRREHVRGKQRLDEDCSCEHDLSRFTMPSRTSLM